MDLDTFFVSVERLQDGRLNGKPVILGGTSDRGVVASCSYEARAYGVHSGMPIKMARRLCPDGTYIRGNMADYSKYSDMVSEIIMERAPLVEKASIDEFYADLTGIDRYFGVWQFAGELRQRIIRETGLPISFGLSSNKIVSKIATGEAKPNNQLQIDQGTERPFLAPLSVKKIPGVGAKTFRLLSTMGIRRVHTLQQMPQEMMYSAFGKSGRTIWQRANALDDPPVIPYSERKSISTEHTFSTDTMDVRGLKTLLQRMVEKLAYSLRSKEKLTGNVAVKIRYSDFQTYTKQKKIPYTSADHIIIPAVMTLFDQLFQRRVRVRLVGVRLSNLTHGHYQIDLFEDTEKRIALYKTMDRLRDKFGSSIIGRASAMGAQTYRY